MPTGIPAQDTAALMRTFDAGQFTQGTTKDFSDRDPMHSFDMTRITTPHIFFAVFSVAKIDPSGGFHGFLNRLLLDFNSEMRGFWAIVLVLVGDPSSGKSPALDLILDAIKKIDADLAREYQTARGDWSQR